MEHEITHNYNVNTTEDAEFQKFVHFRSQFDLQDQLELEDAQEEQSKYRLFISHFDDELITGRAFM